jgi:very-short-patch-repair endonuclease
MPPEQLPEKTAFVRKLRREQTAFESTLWKFLKAHQLDGLHFRRQHPIGPYIADFACIKARLIVELDGNSHDERIDTDANRDTDLEAMGWRVLRFPNVYLRDNPDALWQMIEMELTRENSK